MHSPTREKNEWRTTKKFLSLFIGSVLDAADWVGRKSSSIPAFARYRSRSIEEIFLSISALSAENGPRAKAVWCLAFNVRLWLSNCEPAESSDAVRQCVGATIEMRSQIESPFSVWSTTGETVRWYITGSHIANLIAQTAASLASDSRARSFGKSLRDPASLPCLLIF